MSKSLMDVTRSPKGFRYTCTGSNKFLAKERFGNSQRMHQANGAVRESVVLTEEKREDIK